MFWFRYNSYPQKFIGLCYKPTMADIGDIALSYLAYGLPIRFIIEPKQHLKP